MEFDIVDTGEPKDEFLSTDKASDRLVKEWEEHGYLIIAFDFDHTVYDTDGVGDNHDQIVELLKVCSEIGCYLIVYTCRGPEDYDMIKEYLSSRGITPNKINDNCPFCEFQPTTKIYYNIFLDDRCGLGQAYETLVRAIEKRLRGLDK